MTPLPALHLLLACAAEPTGAALPPDPPPRVVAVIDEIARAAARPLWPGFDPTTVPLEIFDGEATWLFHHPSPPPEFERSSDDEGARVAPGRHASVRANTSIELAGVATATAILDPDASPRRQAALVIHEIFHVFQAKRHPQWGGNEVDLLSYPVDSPVALALRRLESEALRRASAARGRDRARTWAAAALRLREERFRALSSAARNYERGTESKEGLARYVETRAAGSVEPPLPEEEFPPQQVRLRAYASGCALALLLDRFSPDWKARLEANDRATLDGVLAAALERPPVEAAAFTASRRRREGARAARDLAELARERARAKRAFEDADGWRIEVVAEREPLWPKNFDPWNVDRLGPAEVLHTRWVKLANATGELEVLDRRCLTVAAGADPLFTGVRRAIVTGLEKPPTISEAEGSLRVQAKGFDLTARAASIEREGTIIRVKLNQAPK